MFSAVLVGPDEGMTRTCTTQSLFSVITMVTDYESAGMPGSPSMLTELCLRWYSWK